MFSIAIVDDHKHLVESLATTIPWEEYGITHVYKAYTGKQALALLLEHDIHILLTDIRMPEMSGLELITKIRELELDTECLLLTGYADFQYAKQAIELGAVNYLLKPVRDEELLPSIKAITERCAARETERSIAQIAAREERRRIAHDLHDILGYTLSTTLVNLEAAKMLLSLDKAEGLERLAQSSELLRAGMSTIRETVSAVQGQDGEEANLKQTLLLFLKETERLTNITIITELDSVHGYVDAEFARMLLHTVQEGITNGLRHGRAKHFQLRLLFSDDAYTLSLWNDGAPYDGSPSGVGITAMRERLYSRGGSLTLTATMEPVGTELTVWIPYQQPRTESANDET